MKKFKYNSCKKLSKSNTIGVKNILFIEVAAPNENYQTYVTLLLQRLGFVQIATHKKNAIHLYRQGEIYFAVNCDTKGRGASREGSFVREHGICASAIGLLIRDNKEAYTHALKKGAIPYKYPTPYQVPVIHGVGDSLIYFVDHIERFLSDHFNVEEKLNQSLTAKHLIAFDHITYAVYPGMIDVWSGFFQTVFNCHSINHAETDAIKIRNLYTPGANLLIRLQEVAKDDTQSLTGKYLQSHKSEGVFEIAFTTLLLSETIDILHRASVEFEKMPMDYYQCVIQNFPESGHNCFNLSKQHIMVDGDMMNSRKGTFLHIYLKNKNCPISFQIVERPYHQKTLLGNFSTILRDSV